MKKTKKIIIGLVLALGLVFVSYFFGMKASLLNKETRLSSDIVKNQIISVKELTTLRYKYTNVGSFENQSEFYGMKVPFTQKKFIISYDGEVNAGVDLENTKVSIDDEKKTIDISLPKAEILNHVIDEDSLTIFDEKNSIFNQLQLKDFSDFRKDEMEKVEADLIESGFLKEADEKTKEALIDILNINPLLEEYTINFS